MTARRGTSRRDGDPDMGPDWHTSDGKGAAAQRYDMDDAQDWEEGSLHASGSSDDGDHSEDEDYDAQRRHSSRRCAPPGATPAARLPRRRSPAAPQQLSDGSDGSEDDSSSEDGGESDEDCKPAVGDSAGRSARAGRALRDTVPKPRDVSILAHVIIGAATALIASASAWLLLLLLLLMCMLLSGRRQ
jgi:hypothetical protein